MTPVDYYSVLLCSMSTPGSNWMATAKSSHFQIGETFSAVNSLPIPRRQTPLSIVSEQLVFSLYPHYPAACLYPNMPTICRFSITAHFQFLWLPRWIIVRSFPSCCASGVDACLPNNTIFHQLQVQQHTRKCLSEWNGRGCAIVPAIQGEQQFSALQLTENKVAPISIVCDRRVEWRGELLTSVIPCLSVSDATLSTALEWVGDLCYNS